MRPRNLAAGLFAILAVFLLGSAGFVLFSGFSVGDAVYLTVITITTVGFGEVGGPFTTGTRLWVVVVLVAGVGALFYTLTAFMEYGFDILLGSHYRIRRKMEKSLNRVTDHIIICGYGRVGATAADVLRRGGFPTVVIENRAEVALEAIQAGFLVVEGDATRDDILQEARLIEARSVIACVASSSDNLVITLSVRAIRPDVALTARAVDQETEKKLKLAGADAVVTPELVGGERIAALATQPGLSEFIDSVVRDSTAEFRIKRFVVSDSSRSVGRTLADLDLRNNSGAMVIGVARPHEPMVMNPDPNKPFASGDCVFGIGSPEQIESLDSLFEGA